MESSEFFDGGSGKKMKLRVTYQHPGAELPERLFVKFSRHFDNPLWDSARHMMQSEVDLALLSRSPDFPVMVPLLMFADLEGSTDTGLLVTELIPYGEGNVDPAYIKCEDYLMPDSVGHYRAIVRSLGRLSGAHKAGRLSPEFDVRFTGAEQGSAQFRAQASEEQQVQWAHRMFDFIQRYPQLFPEHLHEPALRDEFIAYMDDVFAVRDRVHEILATGRPRFVAFGHWNGNIDNCWFERQESGELEAGFIDWANCGMIPITQIISGSVGCAEAYVWADHLDELLAVFIEAWEGQGAPPLDLEEVALHMRLSMVANFGISMAGPVAIARDIADIDAVTGPRDPIFREFYTSRVLLHTMTNMLENWQSLRLWDLVRSLR